MDTPLRRKKQFFNLNWRDVTSIKELIDIADAGATVIRLELDDNNLLGLSTEDIELLTGNADRLQYVKALCFINCDMTKDDLKILFDVLIQLTELEFLDLTNNMLETDGCQLVADFLDSNNSLKHLDLSRCNISSTGITYIIEKLEANTTLRSIILDENQELSSSNIVMLFDTIKIKKNVVLFSVLNTYCDAKYITDLFKLLRKHSSILYLGFPTFFQKKKSFMDSIVDSQDSLNNINKEDLLKFRDVAVQKSLIENLKRNFSLIRVFNQHVRNDVRALLKRNLDLMKDTFGEILLNGEAKNTEFCRQNVLILGRRKSGKSELINSLFGKSEHQLIYDYELEIKKHVVALYKDEGMKSQIYHPSEDESHNFSFHIAARMLAKSTQKTRGLQDRQDGRREGGRNHGNRRNRKRQQLSFYNYPSGQQAPRQVVESLRENRAPAGNALLHSYRNRKGKRKQKSKRPTSRSRYNLDPERRTKSLSMEDRSTEPKEPVGEMRPNMGKNEIADSFDPRIVALHGNPKDKTRVYIDITEISTRVSNHVQHVDKGTLHSMNSKLIREGRRKLTEAEKFGGINKALVDLVQLSFNLKSDEGVLIITFSLSKILKYIRVKEEQMIMNNPIVEFVKENIRCAFSKSKNLQLFLVGTGMDEFLTDADLLAVNIMLQQSLSAKDYKRLVRFKLNDEGEHIAYFPVCSVNKVNIEKLRGEVTKRLYKLAKNNANRRKTKIPLKFIRAFDLLKEENVKFASKQDILNLVNECNIKENEMDSLLAFLKKARLVLYFKEIDMLNDFIIMNKAFFFRLMYQFVNRRYLVKVLQNKDIKQMLKSEGHSRDLSLFKKKMILSGDMIQFVWKNNPNLFVDDDQLLSTSCYLYLIEMMKKGLFITPWKNLRFNLSTLSSLVTPITSTNADDFSTDNIFLIAACLRRTVGSSSNASKMRNIRSFAGSTLKRNRVRSATNDSRLLTSTKDFEKEKPKKSKKAFERPRGGGSFEGAVFSSRARKVEDDFRSRLNPEEGKVIPEDDFGKTLKRGRNRKDLSLRKSSRRKSARKSNRRIISLDNRRGTNMSRGSGINDGRQITMDRKRDPARVSFRPKYLLNRNKPVSIILDFKSTYLPTGLFCRLASALYDQVLLSVKHELRGFKKSIESVEMHQNLFKIQFDRHMSIADDAFSEASTQGGDGDSIYDSEVENRSVSGAKQLGEGYGNKEDKEYIALVKEPNKDSVIMIVRDHDMAPKYLNLLDSVLEIVLPQTEPEEQGTINEYTTMFYHVLLTKKMVKVEVKNKKFISLEAAERRKFAPWFAKNKRTSTKE